MTTFNPQIIADFPNIILILTTILLDVLLYKYINDFLFKPLPKNSNEKREIIYWINTLIFLLAILMYNFDSDIFAPLVVLFGLLGYFTQKTNHRVWEVDLYYPFQRRKISSFSNPKKIHKGKEWTYFDEIEAQHPAPGIFIDIPKIDPRWYKELASFSNYPTKKQKNIRTYFNPNDFRKTIIVVGKMGSGKTEFLYNILSQNDSYEYFDRVIIHDTKGDFIERFYDAENDYIFNPKDVRGSSFDIWEEMKETDKNGNDSFFTGEAFFENMFHELIGQKKSNGDGFWDKASLQPLIDIITNVHYTYHEKSSFEKWEYALMGIEEFKNTADNGTDKSLAIYLSLAKKIFLILQFECKHKKRLPLRKFLNEKGSRIFLSYGEGSTGDFNLLYSSFISSMAGIILAKPDHPSNTMLLFDEYKTMRISDETKINLFTKARTKGACLILGMQFYDSDIGQRQIDVSSSYARFVFKLEDDITADTLSKRLGQVQYMDKKRPKKGEKPEERLEKEDFLPVSTFESLQDFHHITITDKNVTYLGYTPLPNVTVQNESFIQIKTREYIQHVYMSRRKTDQPKISFNDDEKNEMFAEYLKIDDQEGDLDTNMKKFAQKYSLQIDDLDKFFQPMIEEYLNKMDGEKTAELEKK